jgi:YfiR/HmsC-like
MGILATVAASLMPQPGLARTRVPRKRRWPAWRGILHAALWAVLLCSQSHSAAAQSQPLGEYQVKAAFLFNFAKFVEWPPKTFSTSTDPIHLCLLGADEVERALKETIQGKVAQGHPLEVDRLRDIRDAKGCQILFISWSEAGQEALLREIAPAGMLIVGESDGFAREGGMINLVLHENHIRFEINPRAAERANVKISSQLLNLATIVGSGSSGKSD